MKKLINLSFLYAMLGISGGVFYREFTKFQQFSGRTTLAFVHLHLLALGGLLFLILALFASHTDILAQKRFGTFLRLYNIALPLTALMLGVRGVLQVLGTPLSRGLDASISGITGLVHVVMTVALVMMYLSLRSCKANVPEKV